MTRLGLGYYKKHYSQIKQTRTCDKIKSFYSCKKLLHSFAGDVIQYVVTCMFLFKINSPLLFVV